MKASHLRRVDVEYIPESIDDGELYVSERFGTAMHLCACGCGNETVTPLSGIGWTLSAGPTLRPSIGNYSFPCRSHYFLTDGRIDWL
jgi:hypothetical protein